MADGSYDPQPRWPSHSSDAWTTGLASLAPAPSAMSNEQDPLFSIDELVDLPVVHHDQQGGPAIAPTHAAPSDPSQTHGLLDQYPDHDREETGLNSFQTPTMPPLSPSGDWSESECLGTQCSHLSHDGTGPSCGSLSPHSDIGFDNDSFVGPVDDSLDSSWLLSSSML